jgi:hypothetical protein
MRKNTRKVTVRRQEANDSSGRRAKRGGEVGRRTARRGVECGDSEMNVERKGRGREVVEHSGLKRLRANSVAIDARYHCMDFLTFFALTFACANGQCRHALPQHTPLRMRCSPTAVKTVYPVSGSM